MEDRSSYHKKKKIVIKVRFSYLKPEEALETCIPVLENSYFKLGVTFYEDVPGGRLFRPILLVDRFGIFDLFTEVTVKGEKGYGMIEEGFDEIRKIASNFRVPSVTYPSIPVLFNLENIENREDTRTSRGLKNAKSTIPNLIDKLKDAFKDLELEIRIA